MDPGWTAARQGLSPLAPFTNRRRLERGELRGLVALRTLFLTFLMALVLIGVVVVVTSTNDREARGGGSVGAVVVVLAGLVAAVLVRRVGPRLRTDSATALAETYRTRFFSRIAVAESTALIAFAAVLATGNPWLYPLGVLFAAVGFAWLAPTAAHLAADQEQLDQQGVRLSLVAALESPTP